MKVRWREGGVIDVVNHAKDVLGKVLGPAQGELAIQRLEGRVARMSTEQLLLWTETNMTAIGRAFGQWQQEGDLEYLDEARTGAATLVVVLEEVERRRSGY